LFIDRLLTVAVLGANGAVGTELLRLLESRSFPIKELRLLGSHRSAGKICPWKDSNLMIEEVTEASFKDVDIVFASAGGSVSKFWQKTINAAGAVLIDNSSAFRMDPNVPLIVPEVNPEFAANHHGVIANPNCTTILLVLALAPLAKENQIKRVIVSTYQSASGAGALAMEELKELSKQVLNGQVPKSAILPYSLAFNLFLHNSQIQDNNYCEEEMKMVNETRKIMSLPNLLLTATCVRVPVFRAHSESVNIEFNHPFPLHKARNILENSSGVELIEDFQANRFPMPTDVTEKDNIAIGRIRQDISDPNSLELWLCGDQIRKGAALNAIQIAELLLKQ
tara:strand:- start:410 stop:1423 length:1014 start_codon:yes stop_codon:yes gene_type:complete